MGVDGRLATWCARQALTFTTTPAERCAREAQLAAAQAWADCPCDEHTAAVARSQVPFDRDDTAVADAVSNLTDTIQALTSPAGAPLDGWGHDLLVIDIDPAGSGRDNDEWSDVGPGDAASAAVSLAYEVGLAAARATTVAAARLGLLRGLLGEHARLTPTGPGTTNRQEKR